MSRSVISQISSKLQLLQTLDILHCVSFHADESCRSRLTTASSLAPQHSLARPL